MVYSKRRFKKRSFRRKRGSSKWYNKKYSVAQIASTAYRGMRMLKGIVNAERKFVDVTLVTALSNTGDITQLNPLAEGATESTRNGLSVLMKNLFIRQALYMNSAARIEFIRLIVFVDSQQVGDTAPAVTDVLETASYVSPLNRQAAGRFSILYDHVHSFSITGSQCGFLKLNIPVNLHAKYNGAASTDIQKNGVYILRIESEATNHASGNMYSRINYYDN